MAYDYVEVERSDAITGTRVQRGWKTKAVERLSPWTYNLIDSGPWYYPVQYVYEGGVYTTNYRSVAQMYDSSMFNDKLDPAGTLSHVGFRAFEKFKDQCADSASLGASLAEGKQAFSMIADRAGQLFRAAKALKRLRFGDFARELALTESGSKIKRSWQKAGHNLGSVWLEYSYGWKPLVQDIYNAGQVLSNPFYKGNPIRGNSSQTQKVNVNEIQGSHRTVGFITQTIRAQYGATVFVENPNVDELNRLGLINPLSVMWEIVPFSFVLDWFTPIGAFLENFTFGFGLSITRKWYTTKVVSEAEARSDYPAYPTLIPFADDRSRTCRVDRATSWSTPPLPKWKFPQFPRDRALNALSLAVTALSSLQSGLDRANPRR